MARRDSPRILTPEAAAVLPDLSVLADISTGPSVDLDLVTTYLDTAGLDLLRHDITLHRVHGSTDDGWLLQLPTEDGEVERVTAPVSGGRLLPPQELRDLVLSLTLGEPFVEVMTLRTHRQMVELASEGRTVARICDDTISAEPLLAGADDVRVSTPISWREWLLESEDVSVLDDVEEPLSSVAEPVGTVGHADRLRRSLAAAAPLGKAGRKRPKGPRQPKRPKPDKPAGRVLHTYLLEQYDAVLAADRAVRRREPEGIHDLRVALRRLRSTLASFRPLVDRDVSDPLRDQMREISHLLGDARDAEVVSERLARLLDDEPANLRLGAARRTIGDDGRVTIRLGRRTAEDTMRSDEYVAMLRALRDVLVSLPWLPEAEEPAAEVVAQRIERDLRRLRARIAAANDAAGAAERARLLHEARKAAKRLRYTCEAGESVIGDDARRLRRATKDLQDVLGDHHDTMATRSVLRRLAGRGDLHPGTAFTLGRLHAREEQSARRLEREIEAAWARLDRPTVTGWM